MRFFLIFSVFILGLLLTFIMLSPAPALALELDIFEDLMEFTSKWELTSPEIEILRDPFADYRVGVEPEPAAPQAAAPAPQPVVVSPPDFNVQGVVSRGEDRTVILIQDRGEIIMLGLGEVHDGYEFVNFEDNNAYFFKGNRQFQLSPGGGS